MNLQKPIRALGRMCLGATTLIMSLALLLGPAQTSFAKNTPTPAVDHSGTTGGGGGGVAEAGVIDGGGGATGPIELVAQFPKRKEATSTRLNRASDIDPFGVLLFEWNHMGYYRVIWDMFFSKFSLDANESTSYLEEKPYE